MSSPLHKPRAGARLGLIAILAVTGPLFAPAAQAATGGATSTPATTPTFPVPASAKVPPTSTATTPATPATGGTATAPTTTYTPQSTSPAGGVPTTTAPAPTTPSAGTTTAAPASARAARSSKLSTPAIALAAFGALLALICLAWAIARAQAYEPHWARSLRHSLAEGGFRASATWAEFSDWARLGK